MDFISHIPCPPGDFVVLKLDIDTPLIEDAVMTGIPKYGLQHMIGEAYYEHHSTAADMKENGCTWQGGLYEKGAWCA